MAILSCNNDAPQNLVSDKESIQSLLDEYVDGWLDVDTLMVLEVFADSALIIPSGLQPIKGKQNMASFWFPKDSSKTVITDYKIELKEINIDKNIAYTHEHGKLNFTYEKGDFYMEKKSKYFAVTIFQKDERGEWKIVSRSWTDLK